MTGYTVHTGATEKFVAGWDGIFKKQVKAKEAPAKKKPFAAKKTAAPKGVKAQAGKAAKKKK